MATVNLVGLAPVSNGAGEQISMGKPYVARIKIKGIVPYLFHRYSVEAVQEKSVAAKGSKAKKTDDLEAAVWRTEDGLLGIPGIALVMSICDKRNGAAKYRQDPRSTRKSALDLYKAGLSPLTDVAPVLPRRKEWDYVDQRRVVVQQSAITRHRPALNVGWEAEFDMLVSTPEYISPQDLLACLNDAGRLVGIGDFRPTYGRFQVVSFEVLDE